jgi:para-nitrobenzyl esterase
MTAPETTTAGPVARTTSGLVRGIQRDGSAAFLGIPFAQPPIGDLRFAAPAPVAPWEGIRDATAYGPTPQRGETGVTLIPEPSVPGEGTLNVNVYTPQLQPDTALPVLVWIHGGGFISGSPASPWYDGAPFNRDGVVLVAVSYRLGFDGFGDIEGAPSNRGVRDWLAALEWVQENIAAFGGDPDRVTIAGQSAGGGAVLTLLAMPAAQHLFHAAWSLSGVVADVPRATARARTERLAALAGVAADRAGFAGVPEERLLALQPEAERTPSKNKLAIVRQLLDGLAWGPMVDGDLLPRDTVTGLRAGIGADKPLLLGATDDEFTMVTGGAAKTLRFVPTGLAFSLLGIPAGVRRAYLHADAGSGRHGTAALLGGYVTDRVFRSLVARVAAARAAASGTAPTWTYRFSWSSPTIGWACHCLDVPFWFDCLDADRVPAIAGSTPPQRLADDMHAAASGFVQSHAVPWEAWTDARRPVRVFNDPAPADPILRDGYADVASLV